MKEFDDGVEMCVCVVIGVCEEEFEAVLNVRVVRCAWYLSVDVMLVMLIMDGVFCLINCDNVVVGGKFVVEWCWKLDLNGSFFEVSSLRLDVVDFAFAFVNGWGVFMVYFFVKIGDLYVMCFVVLCGVKYL